jgi:hypothetical protein
MTLTKQLDDRSPRNFRNSDRAGENLAAELTEAAFPVALRRGLGTEWLDRKLELWSAMTRTVNDWKAHAQQAF